MTTAIIFIVILAILVFVHELGHFLAAKAVKARVDKFAIGFPPRIFGKKIGETDYAINLIPFGGYVSIHGEQYDSEDKVTEDPDAAHSLAHKNRALQAGVFVAGIVMNVLFAWVLLSSGFLWGLPSSVEGTKYADRVENARLIITGVRPESPAQKAGLMSGDEILFLGTKEKGINPIKSDEVSSFIAPHANEEISFLVKRKGEQLTFNAVAEEGIVDAEEGEKSRGAVGISIDVVGTLRLPIHLAILEGGRATFVMAKEIVVGMWQFFGQAFRGEADFAAVSGPIGIASVVGEVRELGFAYLITFTAFISINLAVLNLLPFPALDGGRILFVALEAIARRRIPAKVAQTANFVGFALLMLLMLVVTYRDIARLITG